MNNKDFILELSQRTGYTQDDTQKLVSSVIDAMASSFEENNPVMIPNFEVKKRLERIMVNPSTQQRMLVPPKLVLSFRPVTSIKEILKNKN